MHLSRVYIRNFRSIRELDLHFEPGKNVIIGRNNTGKSNIIKAVDLILGESTPTYAKSDNIDENDFYSWKENSDRDKITKSANEIFIWTELRRDVGENLDYDEMYKCYGFYVHSQITRWENRRPVKEAVRISKDVLPEGYDNIFQIEEDNSTDKEYINPKLRNQRTFEQQFEDKHHFAFAFRARKVEGGEILKEIRFLYREDDSKDWVLAFKAPIRNELLQSAIIPSFRDPQMQLRLASWSWYGKLMIHLTKEHQKSVDLMEAFGKVKSVADDIFRDVKDKIIQSSLDVAFPGTELHFQFNADTNIDLYKSALIYVDDGFKSLLTEKGSGIQSATIIGLFAYYTQYVNTTTSALLCLEEPELYLHPHARRVISDRLDDFLNRNKNQVIITTHSVELVRTSLADMNLVLVTKTNDGTQAKPIKIGEFKKLLIESNQNEIFFADKVVICEGYEDFILRAICKEQYPKKLDEQNVSIISVGGKDKIATLAKLILKLGIKAFVLTDFDYLLRDKGEEYKKYGVKPHESVVSLGDEFFSQPSIFGKDGTDVLREVQRIRNEIKRTEEEQFYKARKVSNIKTEGVADLLAKLRKNGICVLSGEIEDFSKDKSIMSSSNKINLDKVYELNNQLASGRSIAEVFDASETIEFLETVFAR